MVAAAPRVALAAIAPVSVRASLLGSMFGEAVGRSVGERAALVADVGLDATGVRFTILKPLRIR